MLFYVTDKKEQVLRQNPQKKIERKINFFVVEIYVDT